MELNELKEELALQRAKINEIIAVLDANELGVKETVEYLEEEIENQEENKQEE